MLNRISLPVYPFAREKYWIPQVEDIHIKHAVNRKEISTIHPFLDSNESTLQEQCFKKVFNQNSPFLRDYLVADEKILSGSVCLEMVRAAGNIASPNQKVTKLKDILWSQPLSLKQGTQEVWTHLHPDENYVLCEISTTLNGERIVHATGKLIYEDYSSQSSKKINLDEIQARFTEKKETEECYALLANHHLQYGEELQVIEELHINEKEVLAQLQCTRDEDINDLVLHPALMEGVMQTAFTLAIQSKNTLSHPYLLYALDEIEVIRPLSRRCYVHVIMDSDDAIKKFNVSLYDEEGQLSVVMKKLQLVPTHKEKKNVSSEFFVLSKDWKESRGKQIFKSPSMGELILLVNEESYLFANNLKDIFPEVEVIIIQQKELQETDSLSIDLQKIKKCIGVIDLSDMYNDAVIKCNGNINKIILLQELIKNVQHNAFFMIHLTHCLQDFRETQSTLAGADVAGLIKMLGTEYKKLRAKTVDVDVSLAEADAMKKIILAEIMNDSLESEICYRDSKRYVPYMKKNVDKQHTLSMLEIDDKKVFVVTGGMRGIGAEVARYLVKKGARKLVLMGIKSLPPRKQWQSILNDLELFGDMHDRLNLILELERKGIQVEVYTGSLTHEQNLRTFFKRIRENMGEIGGVVHCAGLASNYNPAFIKKKKEDISQVFEPKIIGVQTLHEIFKEDNLSFFVLFSSISALIPRLGVGVSDYANANAFMDYFATYQNRMGNKFYKSINWPSWKDVGIGEVKSFAYQQTGLLAHGTRDGLLMFERVMKLTDAVCTPCLVNPDQFNIENLLWDDVKEGKSSKLVLKENKVTKHPKQLSEIQTTKKWLKEIFAQELQIPLERLDESTDFGDFGVDSILLIDLVRAVEERMNVKLDPSIFLEYPTVTLLSRHLIENYKKHLEEEVKEDTIPINEIGESKVGERSNLNFSQNVGTLKFLIDSTSELKFSVGHNLQRFKTNNIVNEYTSQKIAVVGMGCHFPGAKDKETFWNNLSMGQSKITEIPKSRWSTEQFYAPHYHAGKSISKWGGFIEDIEYFDPKYFNLNAEDAIQMDPLIRQFLEVSTQTIRDAGYEQKELANKKVGVFVGSRVGNYSSRITKLQKSSIIGIGQNFIGAHLSHFFNFKGPNIVIDTACSSSLVSIHLACKSLMTGESDIALAGGVDILLDENPYLILSEARALSPDGKCHTFDAKANGFVPGEGCGAVLLKPLEQAIKDGNQIYAVIDASAINNDGRTMGITTPNGAEQQMVIKEALRIGRINPSSISYIETHGTGTMIGDPIELKSLTKVFREFTKEKQFCGVGSVKTNIGHLLSAAGIASFIKVVLSLYHKKIPPTLNCETPNERFQFSESPFYPNISLIDWEQREEIRRAGISSFGFGGTNAHIIVSEMDQQCIKEYKPKRRALSPVRFNRSYYWLDKEGIFSKKESNLPSLFEFEMS
ncbi:beta-ketoacyl synthase N-terminal-like domain-containing protein [Bacillus wiedmannii]|uniref:beta-ketoacyl synthase N-terminal-like domain-containing protein n=1 Tax=Bacillus wiedmannii TaxID=1890302 RepID=UPI003FA2A9EA